LKRSALIVLAIGLVLAGLVLYRYRNTSFDWATFFTTLTSVDWTWLTISVILMLATYVGRALRWEVMIRPLRPKANFKGLCSATIIGFTAVVLFGRPGEIVRPYLIALKEELSFPSQMAAWLLERILDALAVLLLFGFALSQLPGRTLHLGTGLSALLKAGGFVIAGLGACCAFIFIVFRNFSEPARQRILSALTFLPEQAYNRIEQTLVSFSEGMQSTRDHGFLALLVFYTLLEWMVIVAAYYALFQAFTATTGLRISDTLIFVGFIALGSIVQIPGIGGGIQVATVVVLSEIFGLSFAASSGLALMISVLAFFIIVPFGLILAFHEGVNWKKLKHLQENAV
jgi:uncharacterized protein (TIRG00374 family)